MKGMGDQVIRVPVDILHAMMTGNLPEIQGWQLPKSVDIIGCIDPGKENSPWVPDDKEPCVYIRIQHKYCFRRPKGAALCIENYTDFIERFRSVAKTDAGI